MNESVQRLKGNDKRYQELAVASKATMTVVFGLANVSTVKMLCSQMQCDGN